MADADTEKHKELLTNLQKAKSVEDAIGVATEAFKHVFDHFAAQEARIKALEGKTSNVSSKDGTTFIGG